jgi:hypothetical protein
VIEAVSSRQEKYPTDPATPAAIASRSGSTARSRLISTPVAPAIARTVSWSSRPKLIARTSAPTIDPVSPRNTAVDGATIGDATVGSAMAAITSTPVTVAIVPPTTKPMARVIGVSS